MSKNLIYKSALTNFFSNYGMLAILVILGLLFSILTIRDQYPTGEDAAKSLSKTILGYPHDTGIVIISRDTGDDIVFAASLQKILRDQGFNSIKIFSGDPNAVRSNIAAVSDSIKINMIAASFSASPMAYSIKSELPKLSGATIISPSPYRWPTFLLPDNLRNVANQIAVIAIIAIGMTLVIITAGIDLSVGSLVALSAVVTAWFVGQMGGESATFWGMLLSGLIAIVLCGLIGAFSGLMITRFRIPPFIATLAMMQVAAGFAYVISEGKPIYRLPDSFILLGRGAEPIFMIPYAVLLMIILYIAAHILMTRTTTGRYIYAVGGNMEAARLAGIRVKRILFFVYMICGALAGLGGVVMASQLKSGAPTYGVTYELYVIAAVVVGGTSLSGGEGRIFGTLIGAFIIAVIQNGMNLTNVETYTQKIVLGVVILGAVLLDRLKQRGMGSRKLRG